MKLAFSALLFLSSLGTAKAKPTAPAAAAPTPAPSEAAFACRKIAGYSCSGATNDVVYRFLDTKLECDPVITDESPLPKFVGKYNNLCLFTDALTCICHTAQNEDDCQKDPLTGLVTVRRNLGVACADSISPDGKFAFVCSGSVPPSKCVPKRRFLGEEEKIQVTPIEQAEFEAEFFAEYSEDDDETGVAEPAADNAWMTQNSVIGQGNSLRAFTDNCGDYEYDGMLQVHDAHLYAVALPKEAAIAAGCPTAAFHSVIDDADTMVAPQKEFFIWQGYHETPSEMTEGALHMGTFKLSDISNAYEKARASQQRATYDVLKNNCAGFMIELGTSLGVKIDTRVTGFVTRRLVSQKGKELAETIRGHVDFLSLFADRNLRADTEGLSDEALVEMVVDQHVTGLQ